MTDKPIALEDRDRDGARMFSPSAGRNKGAIAGVLAEWLPEGASVLEVGSGTGEHGAALGEARADLRWQYSDPDAASRASQAAWAKPEWPEPLDLDLRVSEWWDGLPRFDAVFSANMIHIAPIKAAIGLAEGAAQLTDRVFLYGPFLLGEDSAQGNLDFDMSLRRRDPRWGVRELESVKHIFAERGFTLANRRDMPANNLLLEFAR